MRFKLPDTSAEVGGAKSGPTPVDICAAWYVEPGGRVIPDFPIKSDPTILKVHLDIEGVGLRAYDNIVKICGPEFSDAAEYQHGQNCQGYRGECAEQAARHNRYLTIHRGLPIGGGAISSGAWKSGQ
jgi:hypothetical protein